MAQCLLILVTLIGLMSTTLTPAPRASQITEAHKGLPQSWQAAAERFKSEYPKTVDLIERGERDIDRVTFRVVWKAYRLKNEKVLSVLTQFETLKITVRMLPTMIHKAAAKPGTERHVIVPMSACTNTCEWETDLYVMGCFAGGGSQFQCWVVGEWFNCMCRNGCTSDPGYMYIDCGEWG